MSKINTSNHNLLILLHLYWKIAKINQNQPTHFLQKHIFCLGSAGARSDAGKTFVCTWQVASETEQKNPNKIGWWIPPMNLKWNTMYSTWKGPMASTPMYWFIVTPYNCHLLSVLSPDCKIVMKNCAYAKVLPGSRLLASEVAHFLAKPEIEDTSWQPQETHKPIKSHLDFTTTIWTLWHHDVKMSWVVELCVVWHPFFCPNSESRGLFCVNILYDLS